MSEGAAGRSRHVTLYLGTNQMGKSHLARAHAATWQRQNPDAPIFEIGKRGGYWVEGADLNPNKANGFLGREGLYPFIQELTNNGRGPYRPPFINPRVGMKGALVRFEDGDGFIPQKIQGTPYQAVFLENAHCYLDVQVTAHRPQTIDKNILGAAHWIYLFAMQESYAREYLQGLGELKDSEVLKRKQFPKKRGQYICVRNDPSHQVAIGATFHDDFDPRLARGQEQAG